MRDEFAECVKGNYKSKRPASAVLKAFYDVIKSGLKTKEDIIGALEESRSEVPEDKIKHLNNAIKVLNSEHVPDVIIDSNGEMQELQSLPSKINIPGKRACELYNYMKDCINSLDGGGRKRKNKYRGKKTKRISKKRKSKKRKAKKSTKRKNTKKNPPK